MQDFRTVKEQALDHLSVTSGDELDISCNITHSSQIEVVLESEAHSILGSQYKRENTERLLRLTCGFMGRHRSDVVEIAKAAKMDGGDQ